MSLLRGLSLAPIVALVTVLAWPYSPADGLHDDVEVSRPRCWHLGEDITVAAGETLDCSLVVVGGDVSVERTGTIAGDLAVPFGHADVEGAVAGNAFASGGLRLGEAAIVDGDATSLGEVEIVDGARVGGRADRLSGQPRGSRSGALDLAAIATPLTFLAILALLAAVSAALGVVAIPTLVAHAGTALGNAPRYAGSLLLGIVVGGVGLALALITFPTIFLPLVILAVVLCAIVSGGTAFAVRIGTLVARGRRETLRAGIGAALITFIVFGPLLVPRLGTFVAGVLLDMGLLAMALGAGLVGMWRAWQAARGGPLTTGHTPTPALDEGRTTLSSDEPAEHVSRPVAEDGAAEHLIASERVVEPAPLGQDEGPEPRASLDAVADAPATPPPIVVRDLDGMTPIYAHLLARAGFGSFAELAGADPTALLRVLSVPGIRPVRLATAEGWVRAAKALGFAAE